MHSPKVNQDSGVCWRVVIEKILDRCGGKIKVKQIDAGSGLVGVQVPI